MTLPSAHVVAAWVALLRAHRTALGGVEAALKAAGLPHLEWYDLRDFVVYDQPMIAWPAIALATIYAAVWTAIFLFIAWLGFRRKGLNT